MTTKIKAAANVIHWGLFTRENSYKGQITPKEEFLWKRKVNLKKCVIKHSCSSVVKRYSDEDLSLKIGRFYISSSAGSAVVGTVSTLSFLTSATNSFAGLNAGIK